MAGPIHLPNYYTSNGNLFAEGTDEILQNEARQATAVVLSMINQNDQARAEVENWAKQSAAASAESAYIFTAVTIDTLDNPWFWLSMYSLSHRPFYVPSGPIYGSEGCCTGGGCTGGGCSGMDGDSCKAILLVIAIGILVAAFVASLGLTVKHGMDADEARSRANELKQMYREAQDERIQKIYGKIFWEQSKEFASQTLKTTFTATATAGVGFLTVSAVFALYAILNSSPMSPYATLFAIAGGGAIGGSLLGHAVRGTTLQLRKGRDLRVLHELYNEIMNLEAPHPYRILAETSQQNATLTVGEYRYIKEGTHFRKEKIIESPSMYADYVNFAVGSH